MPELTPQSTTPNEPLPPTVPPPTEPTADDPPDDPPPAIPPIIDPARYEDFPVLRETFLLYVTDPGANASLRSASELLFDLILNFWGDWPNPPEGLLRAGLRAAVADMRCVQGFLADLDEGGYDTAHEEHLAGVGVSLAPEISALADRIERELGTWRGEV